MFDEARGLWTWGAIGDGRAFRNLPRGRKRSDSKTGRRARVEYLPAQGLGKCGLVWLVMVGVP